MRRPRRLRGALLAIAFLGASCDDPAQRPESPAARFERESAYRQVCAAEVLARTSEERLLTLESTLETLDPSDPLSDLNRRVTTAALGFARAYERHAELRYGAYAYMDSAVNHAATTADSARYISRASAFSIRAPEEGTVEANVFEQYQADLVAILSNENHTCNWDFPF